MTNDECILDLRLRSEIRNTYPGACAIEVLSHLEILINKLIGWDSNKQVGHLEYLEYLLPMVYQSKNKATRHYMLIYLSGSKILIF